MFTCPVCGYDQLEEPAANYSICPSCGTEFGYHDYRFTHAELRQRWLDAGAQWHSRYILRPPHWEPYEQLSRAGLVRHPELGSQTSSRKSSQEATLFSGWTVRFETSPTTHTRFQEHAVGT